MLLQPCSRRISQPLSWISRSKPLTMPLRAKIQNAAFTQSTKMSEPQLPTEQPGDEPDDVLFGSIYGVRSIELNRPKKLNSLNASMARKILPRLKEWEKSELANVIIMAGAGDKALCAGGDVAALAELNKEGKQGQQVSKDYFGLEYQVDHLIATLRKPYIAYMDGITMGGGVGLSVHAPFRITTERTVFAMPETTIGFFPDVGGGFFLPRLDGYTGRYLALTSERLKGVNAFYAGIGTHYIHSSSLGDLTARLSELDFEDTLPYSQRLESINTTIEEFNSGLPEDEPPLLVGELRRAIDRCFRHHTIEEILDALKTEEANPVTAEWARKTAKTMLERSPTSLKVTLRQMIVGQDWKISEAFQNEFNVASKFMEHPDFVEGVEARLKKPTRTPKWNPERLEDVKHGDVDRFFSVQGMKRLELFGTGDYRQYSEFSATGRRNFGLPTEADVRRKVLEEGATPRSVEDELAREYRSKVGAREKIREVLERKCTMVEGGDFQWERA